MAGGEAFHRVTLGQCCKEVKCQIREDSGERGGRSGSTIPWFSIKNETWCLFVLSETADLELLEDILTVADQVMPNQRRYF